MEIDGVVKLCQKLIPSPTKIQMTIEQNEKSDFLNIEVKKILKQGFSRKVIIEKIDVGAMGALISRGYKMTVLDEDTLLFEPTVLSDLPWPQRMSYAMGDINASFTLKREQINNYLASYSPDSRDRFVSVGWLGQHEIKISWREGK